MIFKCCEWALYHLVINPDDLTYCCASFDKKLTFIENYHGELIDINKYLEARKNYIERCKRGDFPDQCRECPTLEERDWDETAGFIDVSVSNRTKCSCDCIYCIISCGGNSEAKKKLNSKQTYEVKPVLQQLKDAGLFKNGCHFIIGGGECAEYPNGELQWLIDFIFSINGSIEFLSAGITYSESIKKALEAGEAKLKVSVDAGTKQTYEKIKRVKGFDKVWKNLKNYIKASKKNPKSSVVIKYIIIPGINDNLKEAKEFIKNCKKAGCSSIEINVEFYWMNENFDKPISDSLKQTLLYFNSLKKENVYFSSNISSHIKSWLSVNIGN